MQKDGQCILKKINFENPRLGDYYEDGRNTGEYKVYTLRGWVHCDDWKDLQNELENINRFTTDNSNTHN